jgi:hypothetical protein
MVVYYSEWFIKIWCIIFLKIKNLYFVMVDFDKEAEQKRYVDKFKLGALEKIATYCGYQIGDLEILGKILSLADDRRVKSVVNAITTADIENLNSYELTLDNRMDYENIEKMLVQDHGLVPIAKFGGTRYRENPVFEYSAKGQDESQLFNLRVKQPKSD